MVSANVKKSCGGIRRRLAESIDCRLGAFAGSVERHMVECPRCSRLAMGSAKLRLAMLLIRTQRHDADLLMRANPVSITKRILGTVREVSATLVHNTIRRAVPG